MHSLLRWMFPALVLIVAFAFSTPAHADPYRIGWGHPGWGHRPAPRYSAYPPLQPHRHDAPYRAYQRHKYWFPKYYGNIHAREIQFTGIPTGDIGFRGWAW